MLRFLGLFHDVVGTVRGREAREGTRNSRAGGGWIARGFDFICCGRERGDRNLELTWFGVVLLFAWTGCGVDDSYPEIMNGEESSVNRRVLLAWIEPNERNCSDSIIAMISWTTGIPYCGRRHRQAQVVLPIAESFTHKTLGNN